MGTTIVIERAGSVGWRLVAAGRRRLARDGSRRSALDALGRPSRRQTDEWIAATDAEHHRYRERHPVADGSVAVVCVSMRAGKLRSVVDNVRRQTHVPAAVIFVENGVGFTRQATRDAFDGIEGVQCIRAEDGMSLGAALNLAMSATDARFIAKFDDDDLYGPNYLADSMRAHAYAGAGVVGKHSYYAYLSGSNETVLRFPANEFRYSSTLAGGTLVIDRDRVGDLTFADVSIGEDRDFLASCHRVGVSTFSADRFNFTQVRSGDNTWTVTEADFRRRSMHVAHGVARPTIDR